MRDAPAGGFAVYIHWPFCQSKCPYCDFNSHVRNAVDHDQWRAALVQDMQRQAVGTEGRAVDSIFFGGGTPSLMEPETVAALIDEVHKLWPATAAPEVTLEANPTSVEATRFAGYARAGVNRVSLGVQALNDDDLRRLGRLHSVQDARAAFSVARDHFDRVSFDLIYARQDQGLEAWRRELTEACVMAVDHLSLYQLTIEPGTRFGAMHALGQLRGLPDDDLGADLFEATQQICGAAGMAAYEVSNHARDGSECRHNLVYWRYGDYLGIGPGAHGRISQAGRRFATVSERMPEKWLAEGKGSVARVEITPRDQANEYLVMGLRLTEGIDLVRLADFGAGPLEPSAVQRLADDGLIRIDGDRLAASEDGRLVLNHVLRNLGL